MMRPSRGGLPHIRLRTHWQCFSPPGPTGDQASTTVHKRQLRLRHLDMNNIGTLDAVWGASHSLADHSGDSLNGLRTRAAQGVFLIPLVARDGNQEV